MEYGGKASITEIKLVHPLFDHTPTSSIGSSRLPELHEMNGGREYNWLNMSSDWSNPQEESYETRIATLRHIIQ